jgi:outer membrane protein assembly factor BamB
VTWFNGESPMISLCDAASGESIWSWESPDLLSGPPVVTRDAVFVSTRRGSLWHLDLEQGSARGVAELPEPIDSPPTLREDGRGLCVVGARQAVYLFDVAREEPECSEIVLLRRRSDTARCQLLWVPPYVIVFENDLISRCFVRVLFHEPAGYRQVRQIELDGRVWQPPVLDGADILVVTDRWKTHCFGLDPGNSAVNLYTAATQIKPSAALAQPARPFAIRVSEVPFVSLTDALYGYRADRAQGLIREVWSRPLPHAQSRSVQPLQAADGLIVATLEDPESGGTLLQAFSSGQGELIWEAKLAQNARDLSVVNAADSAEQFVAHTDAGHVFLITRDRMQQQSASRVLGIPAPSSIMRQARSTDELVYGCDGGTAIQVVSTRDWSRKGESIRSQPIASELAVYEGELSVRSDATSDSRSGRWVLYITADRSLNVRPFDSKSDDIHAVRLPAAGSVDEPWRWAPVICADSGIIAAHPRGVLCRSEVQSSDGIVHLAVAEQRADLPPLLMAPIPMGNALLALGRDGRCLAVDSKSLRTRAEWQAPGPVQSAIAGPQRVWVCLEDSTVLSVHFQDGKFEIEWQQRLNGSGWMIAEADQDRFLAVQPDGFIVPLDKATGAVGTMIRAPAPLALLPRLSGDELVLATVDGGLFFVPAPQ